MQSFYPKSSLLKVAKVHKRLFWTPPTTLLDSFGRKHDYLRVSLTERCNLRCGYCMPKEGVDIGEKEKYLDLKETMRLADVFVKQCGVKKIRLTGGEPTVDRKLIPLLEHLSKLRQYGLKTIAMTTNGMTLKNRSSVYKSLGINAINISLDTLQPERFEKLTNRKGWQLVYSGLLLALETKFDTIKLNCVIMKGFNDDEILNFVHLAQIYPIEVRFIEFMPFAGNNWANHRMLTYNQMLSTITKAIPDLERVDTTSNNGISKIYRNSSMAGSIGFISSMSDNFCAGCNRLRITSDGFLKVCLFGREETSLRDLMRNGATDEELVKSIRSALAGKSFQHPGPTILKHETYRPMIKIAGLRMYHTSAVIRAKFSHLNSKGHAIMVNIGSKARERRIAIAEGRIFLDEESMKKISDQNVTKKGDILAVSRLAGIMGAKQTSNLIPLCHQIPLDQVSVDIEPCLESNSLRVSARVEAHYNTGVEMESLTAVSVTLLTLYDMCKSTCKSMSISDIKLLSKVKET